MEQGLTFIDGATAIAGGLFGVGFSYVLGSAVDYRGILWRAPKGYVSRAPLKQGLLASQTFERYYTFRRFAAVVRIFCYLCEGVFFLLFAGGVLELIGWAIG